MLGKIISGVFEVLFSLIVIVVVHKGLDLITKTLQNRKNNLKTV